MTNKEELDLKQFVDMFDTAINSDNPAVKKCFNNLMMIVALVHAEDPEKQVGPFRSLTTHITYLADRIDDLERDIRNMQTVGPAGTPYTYTNMLPSYVSYSYTPPNGGATSITKSSII